ncbi:hypothetical protein BABINDRAFT_159286 [Babjeviella inositovora NRRL Y-12698]|uniref:Uncharacterized protein n=1 Tax=Babjeviella inositovora NRRL Y-12698 TaxID=984486 RepID=A0A1E3R079_9ASCO|nr:uncharacterized protein BABINDRAFT_159286 [Babjeviella inositovora NRRL Y-12698]ODQ82777.1 hypothetical protein BABINDRAFT_159286 [Babjeviella inositovora NRRL Y-12698]
MTLSPANITPSHHIRASITVSSHITRVLQVLVPILAPLYLSNSPIRQCGEASKDRKLCPSSSKLQVLDSCICNTSKAIADQDF